jgi:hypothetical protein
MERSGRLQRPLDAFAPARVVSLAMHRLYPLLRLCCKSPFAVANDVVLNALGKQKRRAPALLFWW